MLSHFLLIDHYVKTVTLLGVKFTPIFSFSNIKLHTPRYSLQISSALAVEKTNMNQIQGIGVEKRVEWDVIDFCSGCVCWGIDARHNSEIPVTLLSSSIISQQQRDGEGEKGQFGRCAQDPVFSTAGSSFIPVQSWET